MKKEITSNLTFSGKEAEKINISEIEAAVSMLNAGGEQIKKYFNVKMKFKRIY